MSANITA
jgi:hypothetical protein